MFKVGDIVVMPADQIDDEVYGIITGLDGQFYKILWFDGQDSSEAQGDIIKVDTDV